MSAWERVSVKEIRVGILGHRGYSGQELIRYLKLCSGWKIQHASGREGLEAAQIRECDVVFLCTPNEVSLEWAPKVLSEGVSVIDLSGAFRLKEHSYSEWYGFDHSSQEWLSKSEYALQGFTEVKSLEEQPGPRLIANPGCYATATELALIPLVSEKLVKSSSIYVDAKSGTTGAGKKASADLLFSELFGEFKPYRVGKHQHWPEIVESVSKYASEKIEPVFVTELLPVERGISVASFFEWHESVAQADRMVESLTKVLASAYEGREDILVSADPADLSLKKVQFSNRIHIVPTVAFAKPVVFSMIDNLGRGAAGQALMNAHSLFGQNFPRCLL